MAGEMEREGFELPLLIGGATTSRTHTAVKIEPRVPRPGRPRRRRLARGGRGRRAAWTPTRREAFAAGVREEYETLRRERGARQEKIARHPIAEARRHRLAIDWSAVAPPRPSFLGVRTLDDQPARRARRADRLDAVLRDLGAERPLPGDPRRPDDRRGGPLAATRTRRRCSTGSSRSGCSRRAPSSGFWPANSVGDDIELYTDERRRGSVGTIHTLRQQMVKPPGRPNLALADFTAPRETGLADYVGGVRGDRRAPARRARRRVRGRPRRLLRDPGQGARRPPGRGLRRAAPRAWSGASCGATRPTRRLTNDDLIAERYQGIRPAPGYPACPDHTEKGTLFELLDAEARAGIRLTESFAMLPAASVSGYYFWHPQAAYFGLGRIGRDQLDDYAHRKGMPVEAWRAGWPRTSPRTERRRDRSLRGTGLAVVVSWIDADGADAPPPPGRPPTRPRRPRVPAAARRLGRSRQRGTQGLQARPRVPDRTSSPRPTSSSASAPACR